MFENDDKPKRLTMKRLSEMREHLRGGKALTNEMIADLLDHLAIVEQSEQEWMDEAVAWRSEDSLRRAWEGNWTPYAADRYEKQRKVRLNFAGLNSPKLCPKCLGKREFEVWPRDADGVVVGQDWEPCDLCKGTGQIIPVSS